MTPVLAEPQDTVLRPHAEQQHQAELAALAAADDRPRPPGWRLSPWAVTTYLLGGSAADGTVITPKYVGSRRLIEVAVATLATDRDRGVNELSSALRRRFNTVVLPVPASAEQEVDIVTRRVAQLGRSIGLPDTPQMSRDGEAGGEIRRVVTVFRELRQGVTEDGRAKVKSPSGTLSTAEAISVVTSGLALAAHFGDGVLRPADIAGGITGAVVQDPVSDRVVWQEYLETVVRERDDWSDFYRACRDVAG